MLARKYEAYELEEQVYLPRQRAGAQADPNRRVMLNRIMLLASVLLATYMLAVVRSEAAVHYGHQLVSLQRQEAELAMKNSELRIAIEQMRGPERIISLAEQRLGMSVARSNIYVKAAGGKNSISALAMADK